MVVVLAVLVVVVVVFVVVVVLVVVVEVVLVVVVDVVVVVEVVVVVVGKVPFDSKAPMSQRALPSWLPSTGRMNAPMHVCPFGQLAFAVQGVDVATEQWPGPRWSVAGGGQSAPPASSAGLLAKRAWVRVGPP